MTVAATAATATAVVAAAVDGGSGCGGDDDDEEDDGRATTAWSNVPCEREGKWSSRLRGQGRKWVLPERRRRREDRPGFAGRRRKSGVLYVGRRQRQKGKDKSDRKDARRSSILESTSASRCLSSSSVTCLQQ